MSYDEIIVENPQQVGICERKDCRNNPSGVVVMGQPFDMWVESSSHHRRTVVIHRECNDRADHTKDWV
jgi:hypothetical protein